ncbi:MAG: hypothetical protein L6R39_003801 [Caloplaca ligustica]|nr:MAG: hypothetical protein L6R39_003801 [Caloplaca ligustica]
MAPGKRGRQAGVQFLALPREIRDRIYDEFLDLDNLAPADPRSIQHKPVGGSYRGHICIYPPDLYDLCIPTRLPEASSAALLGCNRRIRAEISQLLSTRTASPSRNGLTYALDILVEATHPPDGSYTEQMYATWVKMPVIPVSHAKCIRVDFRAVSKSCSESTETCFQHCFWFIGNGGIGLTTRSLLNLLARFFAYGPTFEEETRMARPLFIEELVVNVLPTVISKNERIEVLQGLSLLRLVADSGLLAGKLGRISIHQDGKMHDQWDVVKVADVTKTIREWRDYGWIPQ